MQKRKNKAQSFVEYAILIAVAVGVLMAMRIYIVRGVQEKYRQGADIFGQGEQYEKGVTEVTNLDGSPTILPPPPGRTKSCSFIVSSVATLEEQAKDLRARADDWDKVADDTEAQLPALKDQAAALITKAEQKEAQASDLRTQAVALTAEADAKQAQVDQYKKDYPSCFSEPYDEFSICNSIVSAVAQLEIEISDLRSQAESLNNQATTLEAEAKDLRDQAASLNKGIAKFEEQIQKLRDMAEDFRAEADAKEAQIDQYKKDYPQCFGTP